MTMSKPFESGAFARSGVHGARAGARRGFTVVEVCVVMAVASVLLASLWLVYRGVTKAGRSTEDTALAVARAQLAMERIRTDLLLEGAATVETGEGGSSLKISKEEEVLVAYERTESGRLARTASERTDPGPEETEAVFKPIPGKPQSVALTVTSTSHLRSVVLRCEHISETGSRRLQHPEWNRLAMPTPEGAE